MIRSDEDVAWLGGDACLDIMNELRALRDVRLHRLLIEKLVHVGVLVVSVISRADGSVGVQPKVELRVREHTGVAVVADCGELALSRESLT